MITITEYSGQKIGVFGLGKAGEATVASLLAGGAEVWAWDDKGGLGLRASGVSGEPNKPQALSLKPYQEWPWNEIKALVLSPGVPLTHPKPHPVVMLAKKNNCPVIGDIELLYRAQPKARYVGITGTNGKSTTTTLIGHILKEAGIKTQVGGNLGTAALSLEPLGEDGVYVLELSSYQLDLVKTTRFNVAVLLNITPDHLDRHGSMEGYIAAKKHIFDRQDLNDKAIIAIDDEYTSTLADELYKNPNGPSIVRVSASQTLPIGVYVQNGILYDTDLPGESFDLRNIVSLTGRHNWQNTAAAFAVGHVVAKEFDISISTIYEAIKTFPGLRHRLQLVATIKGVRFINDSKATNADATSNALAPYEHIYWIAGGKPKTGGIDSLGDYFPKISHAFLIGEAEEEFARTLKKGKVPFSRCGALSNAVEAAAAKAFADGKKDAVVLLSPACASFDQWKNFEERGDAFCDLVLGLDPRIHSENTLDPRISHCSSEDKKNAT